MDVLRRKDLEQLSDHSLSPCVSLYLPNCGAEEEASRLLAEQLDQARQQLVAEGVSSEQAELLLQPASQLIAGDYLWRCPHEGVAIFCSVDFFRAYCLPAAFVRMSYVGSGFYLRPLLPLFSSDVRFFVLALSENSAKLYQATPWNISELPLELPSTEPEKDGGAALPGYRSWMTWVTSSPPPADGKPVAPTAAGEESGESYKRELLRFFQRVDQLLQEMLRGEQAPMILACVGYLAAFYQAANTYPYLIQDKVPGSPGRWTKEELRVRGYRLLERYVRQQRSDVLSGFERGQVAECTGDNTAQLVGLAERGEIETLLIAQPADAATGSARQPAEVADDPLLDLAAIKTLTAGGSLYYLTPQAMPRACRATAILRRIGLPATRLARSEHRSN